LDAVALFLVFLISDAAAQVFFERREKVEGNVGGLEALTFRVGDVVGEAAVGGDARSGGGLDATGEGGGVASGEQAAGDGLGVAFDARELAGDEDRGMGTELEGFGEEVRRVDVGVAVDLAVAQEGGVFEAGNEAEDARLFAELEVILKPTRL